MRRLLTDRRTIGLTLAGLLGLPAAADNKSWNNPAGGAFNQSNYWTPAGVPGSGDTAIFNLDATYSVFMLGNHTNSRLRVGNDDVSLTLLGATYTLNGTAIASVSIGGAKSPAPKSHGTLSLTNGTLASVDAEIGPDPFGGGTVNIGSGATWNNASLLTVGLDSKGTLSISAGGDVTGGICTLGYGSGVTGTLNVSGAGSTFTATSWLDIGGGGEGAANVSSGGKITAAQASLGAAPAATGSVIIDGANSRFDLAGHFRVGEYGAGTLKITGGGFVYNSQYNATNYIGDQSGSSGIVEVASGGKWSMMGPLKIGHIGTASVTLSGGSIHSATGISMTESGLSSANVQVSGTGSALTTAGSMFLGGYSTGSGGPTTVTVENGGELSTGANQTLKLWMPATLNLKSGGKLNTGTLVLGGGSFNWSGGALTLNSMDLNIGPTGPLGSTLPIGAGKSLSVHPSLRVGVGGSGTMNVDGGGVVASTQGYVGHDAGKTGTLTIDGAGSLWTTTDAIRVGHFGIGAVTVSNGGELVSNLDSQMVQVTGVVGAQPNSSGALMIEGIGSKVTLGSPFSPSFLYVGDFGHGTVEIKNGGEMRSQYGGAVLGSKAGSSGTVTVSGAGSYWEIDSYDLDIGVQGTGIVNILDGGEIRHTNFVGNANLGTQNSGTLNVTGIGSKYTCGILTVGNGAAGLLNVSGGAIVTTAATYLAPVVAAEGTAVVDGTGSKLVVSGPIATLGVGSAGKGSLTVSGGAAVETDDTFVGDGLQSQGTLIVSGSDSSLLSKAELVIGYQGAAEMKILAGGQVTTPVAVIGNSSGYASDAWVDGAGALLNVTDVLDIGPGKLGTLTVSNGGATTVSNTCTVEPRGQLVLQQGNFSANKLQILSTATERGLLAGGGSVNAAVENAGRIAPGDPNVLVGCGVLNIAGSLMQESTGAIEAQIGGKAAGGNFDQINVSGPVALGGTLQVSFSGGFVPEVCDTFTILSGASLGGSFASVTLPPDMPDRLFRLRTTPTTIELVCVHPADLTSDGKIDQADLGLLLSTYGLCPGDPGYVPQAGNLGGDACVTQTDLGALLSVYGTSCP